MSVSSSFSGSGTQRCWETKVRYVRFIIYCLIEFSPYVTKTPQCGGAIFCLRLSDTLSTFDQGTMFCPPLLTISYEVVPKVWSRFSAFLHTIHQLQSASKYLDARKLSADEQKQNMRERWGWLYGVVQVLWRHLKVRQWDDNVSLSMVIRKYWTGGNFLSRCGVMHLKALAGATFLCPWRDVSQAGMASQWIVSKVDLREPAWVLILTLPVER